jgi:hypothetical protein
MSDDQQEMEWRGEEPCNTGWLFVTLIALFVLFAVASCRGSVVDERFLDAVMRVESRGRMLAVGDGGKARGPFQFWAAAWSEAGALAKVQEPYYTATNAAVARAYAAALFKSYESRLTRALGRNPSRAELYAPWNMGFSRFSRAGFLLANCPRTTQRACARIEEFCRVRHGNSVFVKCISQNRTSARAGSRQKANGHSSPKDWRAAAISH